MTVRALANGRLLREGLAPLMGFACRVSLDGSHSGGSKVKESSRCTCAIVDNEAHARRLRKTASLASKEEKKEE